MFHERDVASRDCAGIPAALPQAMSPWLFAALGGVLIGIAGALLWLTHGRIAGISGIVANLLPPAADRAWRASFVVGLALAGIAAAAIAPSAIGAPVHSPIVLVIAGLLVGFGTQLSGGCTSGHGVCGLARASRRSIVAVATFMLAGFITATLVGAMS